MAIFGYEPDIRRCHELPGRHRISARDRPQELALTLTLDRRDPDDLSAADGKRRISDAGRSRWIDDRDVGGSDHIGDTAVGDATVGDTTVGDPTVGDPTVGTQHGGGEI